MLFLNKAMISGRLTKDPELRHTPNNIAVTSFSVAVNRRTKDQDQQQTDFIDVVAWRNTAEFVCKYFTKGSGIFVSGRLQVRTWKDNQGNNRKTYEILADEVQFLESKKGSGFSGGDNEFVNTINADDDSLPVDFQEITDDDENLPF